MRADFQKIAEMAYLVSIGHILIIDYGLYVDIENFGEFIRNTYDA